MTSPQPPLPVRAALLPLGPGHTTPPVPRSRAWVRGRLEAWDLSAHEPDLSLIVTELVTNALTHAGGPVTVSLHCDRTRLHLAVTDTGHGQPHLGDPDQEATCGRGLHIVNALCGHWGCSRHGTTKTVWCTRARTSTSTSTHARASTDAAPAPTAAA